MQHGIFPGLFRLKVIVSTFTFRRQPFGSESYMQENRTDLYKGTFIKEQYTIKANPSLLLVFSKPPISLDCVV